MRACVRVPRLPSRLRGAALPRRLREGGPACRRRRAQRFPFLAAGAAPAIRMVPCRRDADTSAHPPHPNPTQPIPPHPTPTPPHTGEYAARAGDAAPVRMA